MAIPKERWQIRGVQAPVEPNLQNLLALVREITYLLEKRHQEFREEIERHQSAA
jgi:hypothetical protein